MIVSELLSTELRSVAQIRVFWGRRAELGQATHSVAKKPPNSDRHSKPGYPLMDIYDNHEEWRQASDKTRASMTPEMIALRAEGVKDGDV